MSAGSAPLHLRLPATSANLGPGFDAVALALALYLEIEACATERFTIRAEGRHADVCGSLEGNLMLDSYRALWAQYAEGSPQPLTLTVRNGIPLGMGCGSSAAARVAAAALLSHFAGLGWSRERMLAEASMLEHHPDNAAACCLGGFTVAASGTESDNAITAVSFPPLAAWHALLVLPEQPLATTESRAVLPPQYERVQVVGNLQNTALLVAAFARGDGALLAAATRDHLHQPYRGVACPLLPRLLPLAGTGGILSVTLSGAGSGILLLLADQSALPEAEEVVRKRAAIEKPLAIAELLSCPLTAEAALLA